MVHVTMIKTEHYSVDSTGTKLNCVYGFIELDTASIYIHFYSICPLDKIVCVIHSRKFLSVSSSWNRHKETRTISILLIANDTIHIEIECN